MWIHCWLETKGTESGTILEKNKFIFSFEKKVMGNP